MSSLEFVVGIHLIVIGLAMANVLSFISDIFRYRERINLSWLHPVWCAYLLFGCLALSFAVWETETSRPSTTVFEVLLFYQWTIFIYLATRILNPEIAHRKQLDLDEYFLKIRKPFFACLFTPSILYQTIGNGLLGLPIANSVTLVTAFILIALGIAGFFAETARKQKAVVCLYLLVQVIQESSQSGLAVGA